MRGGVLGPIWDYLCEWQIACLPECDYSFMPIGARASDAGLITLTGVDTPLQAHSFKPFGASLHAKAPAPSKRAHAFHAPAPPQNANGRWI